MSSSSLRWSVDLVGGVAEALPDVLVLLCGHGAYLFPAGTEVLQALEGLGDRRLHDELFGAFAQFYLLLEVALLVEGAELAVDLQFVEELFNLEVVVLPEVVHLLAGHLTDGFPALLDVVELVHSGAHLLLFGVDELAHLFDKGLLGLEVLFLLLLEVVEVFLACGAVLVVQAVHLLGHSVVFVLVVVLVAPFGDEFLEGGVLHLAVQFVETGADGGHAVSDFLDVLSHEFLHGFDQLLAGAGAVVGCRLGFGGCRLFRSFRSFGGCRLLGVGGSFRSLDDRGFCRLGGGNRGFVCLDGG